MKLVTLEGSQYVELESKKEVECIRFLEKALIEQLESIPDTELPTDAVMDVMEVNGNGAILGVPHSWSK